MASGFARNSVYASVTGLSITLGNFLSSILVARLLGVEGTGVVAYMIWLVATVVVVADLGITICLSRYLPELRACGHEPTADSLAAFLIWPFAISGIVAPLILVPLSAFLIADPAIGKAGPSATLWGLVGLCCITQSFASFGIAYLQGMQQFQRAALLSVLSLLVLLVSVSIGCLAVGPIGALCGYSASNLVLAITCVGVVRRDRRVTPALKARVLKYARYNWATAIVVAFVFSRLELFFLDQFQGSKAVALFSVGLTLSSLATQGPLLLTRGAFYYFAEQLGRADDVRVREAFVTGTRLIAFLIFPACLGAAGIMPRLLPLIYGPSFIEAVPAASILVCTAGLVAAGTMISNLLLARERNSFILWNGVIGALVATVFGITIIPIFGVLGAAYGRAIIQSALSCSGMWYVARVLRIPIPFDGLARLLAAALLCALVARMCIVSLTGPAVLPLSILAGCISYMLGVRLLKALPNSDIDRLLMWSRALPPTFGIVMSAATRVMFAYR
jgi:O-antigen/teichoic acid export membrane protein